MSVRIMSSVFSANVPELKTDEGDVVPDTTAKFVLLALADNANDEGEGAYPGIETLTHKTNFSNKTVCNALNALRNNGYIELVGRSKYDTNNYTVHPEKLAEIQWDETPKCSRYTSEMPESEPESVAATLNPSEDTGLTTTLTHTPDGVGVVVPEKETTETLTDVSSFGIGWKMAAGLPIVPADFTHDFENKLSLVCSSMPAHLQEAAIFFAHLTGLLPDSKRDLSRWRGDLKQWYDKKLEKEWLTEAYKRMKKEQLTVSAPGSLTNIASALRAESWKKTMERGSAVPKSASQLQMALAGTLQVAPKPQ